MKKEKEILRESKLTCYINLYKIKSVKKFAEFIFKQRGGISYDMSEMWQ